MLQELATQNRREMRIGIRERVFFRIEQIDLTTETLAGFRGHLAMMMLPRGTVVATADLAVSEARLERRSDLEVGAHLQNPLVRRAGRSDRERFFEPREMCFHV